MVNTEKLNMAILQAGYTKTGLARHLGTTRQSFFSKMTNRTQFKAREIQKLIRLLGLSPAEMMEIFFAEEVGSKGYPLEQYPSEGNADGLGN